MSLVLYPRKRLDQIKRNNGEEIDQEDSCACRYAGKNPFGLDKKVKDKSLME